MAKTIFINIQMRVVSDGILSVIVCIVTNMSHSSDDIITLQQCMSFERITSVVRGTYRLVSLSSCRKLCSVSDHVGW